MSKKLDEHQISPRLRHPARRRILNRLVGLGFAAPAVGNAVGTMRQAPSFVRWLADGAWIPLVNIALAILFGALWWRSGTPQMIHPRPISKTSLQ
jgi:hypothetical protein